jgi:hypothetical protein
VKYSGNANVKYSGNANVKYSGHANVLVCTFVTPRGSAHCFFVCVSLFRHTCAMCVIRYTGHANVEFKVDSVLSHDDAYVAPPPLVQNKDSNATVNIAFLLLLYSFLQCKCSTCCQ